MLPTFNYREQPSPGDAQFIFLNEWGSPHPPRPNSKGEALCPSPKGRCCPDGGGRGPGAPATAGLGGVVGWGVEAGDLEPKSNSRACGPAVVGPAPYLGCSWEAAGRRGRSPGGAAGGRGGAEVNPGVVVGSGYFPLQRRGKEESGPGGQCPWLVRLVVRERRLRAGQGRAPWRPQASGARWRGSSGRGGAAGQLRGGSHSEEGTSTQARAETPTSLPTLPSQTGTLRSKESEEFFWLRSRYDLAAELVPQRAYQPGRGPSTWRGGPQGGEGSCRRL